MRKYVFNVLLAIDQLVNAFMFGCADESISARSYRLRRFFGWYWTMRAIDLIFFWHSDHCRRAFKAERDRRHLPEEYRR